MERHQQLSVVIPVYNEADNVEILYDEVVAALPQTEYEFEVIFVNDGSRDDTLKRLEAKLRRSENMVVVSHRTNYGQSAALLTGIKQARYPYIVTLDGDGQNDPADIPRLVAQCKSANAVVLGNRTHRDDNRLRRISSWVGNTVRRRLLNDGCRDTGCSLKLFPKEAFLALPHFNHLHRYLPALFQRAGLEVVNVPVNHRPRRHGVSKYGVMNRLFAGIYDLIGVRWLLKRPCLPEVLVNEQ